MELFDKTRAGHKGIGVFRIDATLKGVAVDTYITLLVGQMVTHRYSKLLLDDIDTGYHLGYRVFNLNPGIHFYKIKTAVFIEKLKRSCSPVAKALAGINTSGTDFRSLLGGYTGCRRFFHNLLMTALHGTVPLAKVNRLAMSIGQNLKLDVPWCLEKFLHIDNIIVKCRTSFSFGQLDRVNQLAVATNHSHTSATTTTCGFYNNRIPDLVRDLQVYDRILTERPVRTGYSRDTCGAHFIDRAHFITH